MTRINTGDFSRMFGADTYELPKQLLDGLDNIKSEYHYADQKELEEYILNVLKLINSPTVSRSKGKNFQAWEKGWRENLNSIMQEEISPVHLRPRYFRSSKFLRFNKRLIVSENFDIEYDLFTLARHLIFTKYLSSFENIYEFGCGSCQNLFMLSEFFPSKSLYGLDWVDAPVEIANRLEQHLNRHIKGYKFDMLNPSPEIVIKPHSAVITIHALEQLGDRHEEFLSFLLKARPELILNYEPILEFYDENNLLDYLAIIYSQKRNYLSGYLTALRELEKQNKVKIFEAYRPYLGGVVHESSLVIWRPL